MSAGAAGRGPRPRSTAGARPQRRGSKVVLLGIGAAAVVVAGLVYRALDRPERHPTPAAVEPAAAPPEDTPTPVETVAATPPPREPTARPIAPRQAPPVPAPPPVEQEPLDDATVLATLHDLAGSDPEQSLALAREALARSPRSPDAPEFEWNAVKALFNMGRFDDARDEAQSMVRSYPESDFTHDVVRHLLNPQPNQ